MNPIDKAVKAFKDAFSSDELKALKEQVRLSEEPVLTEEEKKKKEEEAAKTEASTQLNDYTSIDGKVLKVSALEVGAEIMEVVDGEASLANGTYEVDGVGTIVAENGVVASITPKEVVVEPVVTVEEMNSQLSAHKVTIEKSFETKLSDHTKKFETEIAKLKETNKVLLSSIEKILDTPLAVNFKAEVKEKSYDEMTNAEKLRFNKYGKI